MDDALCPQTDPDGFLPGKRWIAARSKTYWFGSTPERSDAGDTAGAARSCAYVTTKNANATRTAEDNPSAAEGSGMTEVTPLDVAGRLDFLALPAVLLIVAAISGLLLPRMWSAARRGDARIALAVGGINGFLLLLLTLTPPPPNWWWNTPITGSWRLCVAVIHWLMTQLEFAHTVLMVLAMVATLTAIRMWLQNSPGDAWPAGMTNNDVIQRWWRRRVVERRLAQFLTQYIRANHDPETVVRKVRAARPTWALTWFTVTPAIDLELARSAVIEEFQELPAVAAIDIGGNPFGEMSLVIAWALTEAEAS